MIHLALTISNVIIITNDIGREARLKEEEEVKKRKEAAARRMAEAKARAEVSVQFSFSLLTIIDPSSSYLSS